MEQERKRVECTNHGSRDATFMCQHLVRGTNGGFHWGSDPDHPDALWPDAWCDACEAVRESEGGWTDRSTTFAAVRLVCDQCYERSRERNWKEDKDAIGTLIANAMAYLQEQQDALQSRFSLGRYDRYNWDQDTGQLVFSRAGQSEVVAEIQFVGSVSTVSNTWLWSWANGSYLESVRRDIRRVRAYGEAHRHLKLVAASWPAEEVDGWEMTAVAAYLLRARGAYRSPGERGFTFMVMTSVGWTQ
jgi:hypothetical protein